MQRRTLLQSFAALIVAPAASPVRPARHAAEPLTPAYVATLEAIAEIVLPSALGDAGRHAAVDRFVQWLRGFHEGADRGHTYGASVISAPTGASPAIRYQAQFAALDELAAVHDARSLAVLPLDARRQVVEAALDRLPRVTSMPTRPNGTNLIADFMGYYYSSEGAYNLAYAAAINRDTCRGLDGSDQPPAKA